MLDANAPSSRHTHARVSARNRSRVTPRDMLRTCGLVVDSIPSKPACKVRSMDKQEAVPCGAQLGANVWSTIDRVLRRAKQGTGYVLLSSYENGRLANDGEKDMMEGLRMTGE